MAKILGIGNTVLDTIFTVSHHPKEDEEMRANEKKLSTGGNVNNSLYVLNQLGHQCSICTTLAADHEAKLLLNGLQQRGLDTQHIQRFIQGQTPHSFVTLSEESGNRTIVHYRDLPEVSFDHFAKITIEDYDWLHFEGRNIENLTGMLNIAKTFLTTQPISLEVEKERDGIEALFPQANVLVFSHHYAKQKGFQNGEELLKSLQQQKLNAKLICTWGNQGVWFCNNQEAIQHLAAEYVSPVIDTLGAGDTFNGALIHALVEGHSLADAVKDANHLAAQKCKQHGLDDLLAINKKQLPLANIKQLNNARATVVNTEGGNQSIVLIKYNDTAKAYVNNCPHQNVPLNEAYKIDVNPFEKTMKCSVHDAFFNIEDGLCVDGPCWNESLEAVEISIDEQGDIFLA